MKEMRESWSVKNSKNVMKRDKLESEKKRARRFREREHQESEKIRRVRKLGVQEN